MKHIWLIAALIGCSGSSKPATAPPPVENKAETAVEPEEITAGPPADANSPERQAENAKAREEAIRQARAAGIIKADGKVGADGSGPANPDPVTTGTTPAPAGPLDKESIRGEIKAHIGEIKLCYEMQLVDRPDLEGTTRVTFKIASDGTVSEASGTGFDANVDSCTADMIKKIRFPAGTTTTVNYPFVFKAAK